MDQHIDLEFAIHKIDKESTWLTYQVIKELTENSLNNGNLNHFEDQYRRGI